MPRLLSVEEKRQLLIDFLQGETDLWEDERLHQANGVKLELASGELVLRNPDREAEQILRALFDAVLEKEQVKMKLPTRALGFGVEIGAVNAKLRSLLLEAAHFLGQRCIGGMERGL